MNKDKVGGETSEQYGEYCAELRGRPGPGGDPIAHNSFDGDNPLAFALFGLARQQQFPIWVCTQWDKPVLDLGPGNKIVHGAIRCEYPEYNFESTDYLPPALEDWFPFNEQDGRAKGVLGYSDRVSKHRATLPYPNDSVGGIYAVNILEHLHDPRPIMEECARVLAVNCPLNIVVPHALHGIALQDLDHRTNFILDTWNNWLQNGYWGPDRSSLRLGVGCNFKFGIKEENVNICTQLVKVAE